VHRPSPCRRLPRPKNQSRRGSGSVFGSSFPNLEMFEGYNSRVLNRVVCWYAEKNIMTNEIAGFGGLNFYFKIYFE
jgi:hypothetical protein